MPYQDTTCRVQGCSTPRHERHVYCATHAHTAWRNGHPNSLAASNKAVTQARREANRLVTLYGNRKATHEAIRLAEQVYAYPVEHGWTMELRCANEGHMLRDRTNPREILLRVVTAYVLFDRFPGNYPSAKAERQQVGKIVLYPLPRRNALGKVIRLTGRVVLMFGQHASSLLGTYAIGLIRKAKADDAELAAAIRATTNFDDEETPRAITG